MPATTGPAAPPGEGRYHSAKERGKEIFKKTKEAMTRRIHKGQGIVSSIRVAIESLRVSRRLNDGIGTQKPPLRRIVISCPEIVEAGLRVQFLPGEFIGQVHDPGIAAHVSVWIIGQRLRPVAARGGGDPQASEVVGMIIVDSSADYRCNPSSAREDVLAYPIDGIDVIELAYVSGHRGAAHFLHPRARVVVDKRRGRAPVADALKPVIVIEDERLLLIVVRFCCVGVIDVSGCIRGAAQVVALTAVFAPGGRQSV